MDDLIFRSATLETINEVDISDCTDIEDIIDRVYAEVASVPTIDAVPVVRCGECKWSSACKPNGYYLGQNGFCSRGARMDAEDK